MLICIDARPLEKNAVGIGNLIKNFLLAQLKSDYENTYLLVSDRNVAFDISPYKNVKIIKYKDRWYCPKSFYYFYCLSRYMKKHSIKPDVFWGTQHILPKNLPRSCNKVLTVHDFTHLFYPHTTTLFNRIVLNLFFKKSLIQADAIVCVSDSTKSDLITLFSKEVNNKNITVISPGGIQIDDTDSLTLSDNIRNEIYDISKEKYVLFIGTIEPRKNIKLLLEAAPKLSPEFHVVICGKLGWESEEIISRLHNTDNVKYLNYVTASERNYLLAHCFCQVQPSIYEGFGLPVIECMQKGSVSLVADNSSLKEIVENPVLRFSTNNVEDFCSKLYNLNNPQVYKKAKDYCAIRGNEYSWEKTAEKYYNLFINRKM